MKLPRTLASRHSSRNIRPLFFWLLLALTLLSAIGSDTPQREASAADVQPLQVDAAQLTGPLTFVQITDMHLFDEGKKRKSEAEYDRDQRDNRDALHWAVEQVNDIVNHGRNIDFVAFTGDFGLEFVRDAREGPPCGDKDKADDKDEAFKKYKAQGWPRYVPLQDAADEVAKEFRRLRVSTIYVLPGNNDLVDENPCDIDRYNKFVAQVAKAMPKGPVNVVDFIKAPVDVKGFRLVGLNSASFKGDKNDAPDQIARLGESLKSNEGTPYLIFTHIPDLDDPYTLDPAWYSGIARTAWQAIIARQEVAAVFAGHFHSYERRLYAASGQKTSSINKQVADKTWIAPPLAMKNQDDKAETARGFLLVQVQRVVVETKSATTKPAASNSTVTISVTPFWYEGPRPAMCWCYVLPVLSVLAVLALVIWGIYGYVTARSQHEDLVKGTYPTLLTLVGVAAIAFVVWKAMRFMISDLSLPAMYWEVAIFGAIGGIFGSLGDQNSFALATYEGPTNVRAGILGDIVTGIGGAIAVVFVSERTLQLKPNDQDSLLWLASISFIAGAAGRKLVQVALQKLFKRLDEVEKKLEDTMSGVQKQVQAATEQAAEAKRVAERALERKGDGVLRLD